MGCSDRVCMCERSILMNHKILKELSVHFCHSLCPPHIQQLVATKFGIYSTFKLQIKVPSETGNAWLNSSTPLLWIYIFFFFARIISHSYLKVSYLSPSSFWFCSFFYPLFVNKTKIRDLSKYKIFFGMEEGEEVIKYLYIVLLTFM